MKQLFHYDETDVSSRRNKSFMTWKIDETGSICLSDVYGNGFNKGEFGNF